VIDGGIYKLLPDDLKGSSVSSFMIGVCCFNKVDIASFIISKFIGGEDDK
jgi:hypothetical protein